MNQLCTSFVYLKFLFSPSLLSCVLWTSTACIYQTPLSPGLQLPAVIKGRRQRKTGRCKEGGGATGCSFSLFFWHTQKEEFPASLVLFSVCTGFFLCWVALAAVGPVIAAVAAVSQTPLQPAGNVVPSSVNSTSFLGVVAAS